MYIHFLKWPCYNLEKLIQLPKAALPYVGAAGT